MASLSETICPINEGPIQRNLAFVMSPLFEGKCHFWNEQVLRNEGFIQMN
jgi:hypothetical protein